MECEVCAKCIIGNVYTFNSGKCDKCGTSIPPKEGTYLGMHGNKHIFRVHPRFRCSCGHLLKYAAFSCNGIDVTEDFSYMTKEIESHWI